MWLNALAQKVNITTLLCKPFASLNVQCTLSTRTIRKLNCLLIFYLIQSYSFIRDFLFNDYIFLFTERRFRFGNTYGDTTRSLPVCMDTLGYSSGSYITMPVMWWGSTEYQDKGLIIMHYLLLITGSYASILGPYLSEVVFMLKLCFDL